MLVHDFLIQSANNQPNKTALVHGKNRIEYTTLVECSQKIAGQLILQGLARGDRVGLLTDDPRHYISSYFGIVQAGGVVVGLNTQTSERSLDTVVSDCRPRFLLLSGRNKKYIPFLENQKHIKALSEVEGILKAPVEHTLSLPSLSEDDIAQIIYTSGTTGKPKGVMLTHRNLVANTLSVNDYLKLDTTDSIMAVLPFFYSYGNSIMLTHIACGGTLVVNQSFVYPNVILDQMVAEKVTGLSGVPSTFAILLHRSAIREYTFPNLRYLTQAGAPMSPALAKQLTTLFSGSEIYIMYGQTEAAPRLSYLDPKFLLEKQGSIGKAIPGVTLEVLTEEGEEAAVGETGEIVASGDNIMVGYWERPEETKKVLRDGKLWTGDLAYRDKEDFLYIVSRKSDLIKSGSHRIAPKEIEEVISELKGVSEVAVTGKEDAILGEAIHAFVVLLPECTTTPKEITLHCRRNLPAFKVPHTIIIIDELPKSDSGKIKKKDL